MKRMAIVAGVCALLAGGLVGVVEAQVEAHCVVRIEADSAVLPLSEEMVQSLVSSAPIIGQAARELNGDTAPPDDAIEVTFAQIAPSQTNRDTRGRMSRQVLVGRIDLLNELSAIDSQQLLKKICERLVASLTHTSEAVRVSLEVQLERVSAELADAQDEQAKLRAQRQELLDEAGRADLTLGRLEDEVVSYEREKRELRFEYESMVAREHALTDQIAKIAETVKGKSAGNEAVAEMEKAFALRSRKLEHAKRLFESGQVSMTEVSEIEAQLAEQRVHLIRMREEVARQMGGNMLEKLNMELIEMGVNGAEMEARLAAVESALQRIREGKLMMLAERYEREVAGELLVLERAVQTLLSEQRDLKTMLRQLQPPSVIIIGE